MTADKRNTAVVMSLVVSMTIGAVVLLSLEARLAPRRPVYSWAANPMLAAERGLRLQELEIGHVVSLAALDPDAQSVMDADLTVFDTDESICLIDREGRARWEPRGPRVWLVLIGSASAAELTIAQKETLLAAIGSLSEKCDADLIPIRLAPELDARYTPDLPPQAVDLRDFLARKRFINVR